VRLLGRYPGLLGRSRLLLPPALSVAVKAFLACPAHGARSVFALSDDVAERPTAKSMVESLSFEIELVGGTRTFIAHIPVQGQIPSLRGNLQLRLETGDFLLGHDEACG